MRSDVALTHRQTSRAPVIARVRPRRLSACRLSFLAAIALFEILGISSAWADDYVLGPQDKLKIRVFEWRPMAGTTVEWAPLTGEFVISTAGNLSMPIIGTVPAAGMTLEQVSDSIGERLKTQVGMQKRPNASVEVAEYRPFFLTGLVTRPGKYSYSPGLTVVQALSMAGGTFGLIDPNLVGLQRDALVARGDLRTLEAERLSLLARQARLDAVTQDQPSIVFPPELTTRADDATVDRMMREEQDLFDTRQRSMSTEIDALNQTKLLATNQIEALNSKAVSLAKQIELANKDVGTVSKLISQGLTVSSRELGANQNLAQLQSQNLDVALANLKARQDIAKADGDIADASNRYRVQALTEATEVRDRLASNKEKTITTRGLLENIQARAPAAAANMAADDTQRTLVTTIDRIVNGALRTIVVGDNDLVSPGDVIRVEDQKTAPSEQATNNSLKPAISP
ncbi:exopolysaccharide biosynthesis protein [Agrobacterium rhizogenes]|uniref:Exopolysaccharide biosynthesis protein (OMA family outer membrane saccharide export protein) n=1 Tax=Rhizobium rhizogenes (strain K84 / ATCC BAA-868) TaxID=311403 RepID=B9JKK1_RHIR8|nr:polysaccharide biosynthesis/export family protein [Rhizobium rhizogenes]ACM30443.1 exopolysaccharide biosynthesis protein (OMA family outer membrane saccharide export protein) [Rhizobium rhizogenes K84]OCJ01766.1 exopolysaccharide biosynthesis protein [Agrobacterium sp. 13-626]OCJ15790.1 exopolysaccharide biosynthesis protein [Agrobacterium sp. B131/95]OCJ19478.1 exopolysaccharide biosynthesis protein [Agrobacterium sp. B133/95]KEA08827.1 exopolysaccharide biosynthesis protein [Rhizobium rh